MSHRRTSLVVAAVVLAAVAALVVAGRPAPPLPTPPGSFSFAAVGDAPYNAIEGIRFRHVLREIDAHDLSFVLHVGDIFWRPCTDGHYRRTRARLDALRHPVVYTPGDNEWFDCWEPGSGSFAPSDRLARIRAVFFDPPARSLGGTPLPLVSQGSDARFSELVENVRWTHGGVVFATAHVVGSGNGMRPFPGRTAADDEDARRRTEGAAAWVRETFAEATAAKAAAVVLGFHASPDFRASAGDPRRGAFEPFLTAIEEEAERFARPVLLVHGDAHEYTVDRPVVRRSTGRPLENVTRLEVPGSPDVGWVRVVVTPGSATPFAFEERVVPRWTFW